MTAEHDPYDLVREFQTSFNTPKDPDFWMGLIKEEVKEANEAAQHLLKEAVDVFYTYCGLANVMRDQGKSEEEVADYIGNQLKECVPPTAVSDFIDALKEESVIEAVLRVHKSNMSKLQPDGTVKRREDGKILKPDTYVAPDLTDLVS